MISESKILNRNKLFPFLWKTALFWLITIVLTVSPYVAMFWLFLFPQFRKEKVLCSVVSCEHNGVFSLVDFSDLCAILTLVTAPSRKPQIFCGITLTRSTANVVSFFRRNTFFFEHPFLNIFPVQLHQSLFLYPSLLCCSPLKRSTGLMSSTTILLESHQIYSHSLLYLCLWPASSTTIWTFMLGHLTFISNS